MPPNPKAQLEILPDAAALSRHVADRLLDLALAKPGPFAIALSGGSTPKALYVLMATPEYRDRFPWPRMHFFWGDERFVPPDDERSNLRLARETLLAHVPAPEGNIHPIPTTGLTPDEAAATYEATLRAYYGATTLDPARPLFDVQLLGLGGDGHTASLFPGVPALDERMKWVAVTDGKLEPYVPRLTLTFPAIDSSAHTTFLIAGEGKRAMLQRLRAGDESLPAAHVNPIGTLTYLADRAAAGPA